MLVSSIGYLNAVKNVYNDDMIKNQNVKSSSLSEGFGHFNQKIDYNSNDNSSFLVKVVDNFKSLFSNNATDESSKFLSLIA